MAQMVVNNFTRGQLDHDMNGRFDLPLYSNGFEVCRNFFSNYKGNVKYRTGLEYVSQPLNNLEAVLMEFKFNTSQAYLLEFTNNKLRFYTYDADGNFGYVVDGDGAIIELTTGITLAQAKEMQKAQNADVMYLTHQAWTPKKLTRVSATRFTIESAQTTGITYSEVGDPGAVAFYSGRLWYSGFSLKPLTVYGSKTAAYDTFTIPSSGIKDDDALKLTLSEITDPITWLTGGKNDLYAGNGEGITVINGGEYGQPITSTAVGASLANHEGASAAAPCRKDSQMFYISADQRKVYMYDYDLMTEKFVSTDLNWISHDITKGGLKKIFYKRDQNYNIYGLLENGQIVTFLYNKDENINGWFACSTNGFVKDMCVVTRPDGTDDLFACVLRNGSYYIERLAKEVEFLNFYQTPLFLTDKKKVYYNRLIAEQLKQCIYLDNSQTYSAPFTVEITYDETTDIVTATSNVFTSAYVGHYIVYQTSTGAEWAYFKIKSYISATQVEVEVISDEYNPATWNKWYLSFNTITGLSAFEGQTVSVVADGGYLGSFTIQNGTLSFDREMTVCTFGMPYLGILKTFNLGHFGDGINLQVANKRINEFILRFVSSAGVKIGTDLSDMQEVQYFNPTGFLDLPPLPMDADEKRAVGDTSDEAKCIYVTQELPLPMNLTMIHYSVEYGVDD